MSVDTSNDLSAPNGNVIKVTRAQVMAARELLQIARENSQPVDPAVAAIAAVDIEHAAASRRHRPPSAATATAPHPTTG